MLWQADDNVESAVAFKHRASATATGCDRDCLLYVANVQTVPGGLFPVDVDREHGKTGGLLDFYFGGARYPSERSRHLGRSGIEHIHIVAKNLDGDIATHARDEFVKAQLDRLRKLIIVTGVLGRFRLHGREQLVTRFLGRWPLRLRLEHHVAI